VSVSTIRALALAVGVIAVDQATKALARASISPGTKEAVFPGVNLVNVRNRGVAFGFLADGGTIVAVVTGAALVALLVFFAFNRDRPLVWLPTGLLLGGAIGNVIDRVRENAVTDFIKLPAWPAFNVADMAITFGVLSLLYVLEGPRRRE
jgi:signal peptidase II